MNRSNWSALNVLYGIVGLIGAFLLYWGIMSIQTYGTDLSITVPWLDQMLFAADRYVWILAVGLLLLTVGISPVIVFGVRSSRVVQVVIGGFGVTFLCVGVFLGLLTLSVFYGFIFVSPLILTGIVLLAVALDVHEWVPKTMYPS